MREFTVESLVELAQKLRESSQKEVEKLNQKHNGLCKIPGYIRLKMSAASAIDYLQVKYAQVAAEKDAAVRDLATAADCGTCKYGPRKKCAFRGECGEERVLWKWRGKQ